MLITIREIIMKTISANPLFILFCLILLITIVSGCVPQTPLPTQPSVLIPAPRQETFIQSQSLTLEEAVSQLQLVFTGIIHTVSDVYGNQASRELWMTDRDYVPLVRDFILQDLHVKVLTPILSDINSGDEITLTLVREVEKYFSENDKEFQPTGVDFVRFDTSTGHFYATLVDIRVPQNEEVLVFAYRDEFMWREGPSEIVGVWFPHNSQGPFYSLTEDIPVQLFKDDRSYSLPELIELISRQRPDEVHKTSGQH
jgi:hypothetical protein